MPHPRLLPTLSLPLEKTILLRVGWQELPAGKSRRVFCISDELLNTPAPTLVQGLQALAWAIHPELFTRPEGIRALSDRVH